MWKVLEVLTLLVSKSSLTSQEIRPESSALFLFGFFFSLFSCIFFLHVSSLSRKEPIEIGPGLKLVLDQSTFIFFFFLVISLSVMH